MSISVGLYRDFARQDEIPFRSVPASHPSDYEYEPEGKHRVLDELTVDKISDELLEVADRPDCHRLLLDFSGVAQLSSAMLAKLLILRRKMAAKREKLRLCGIEAQLRSVFAITKLDRIFDILDTEVGAIQAVASPSLQCVEEAI